MIIKFDDMRKGRNPDLYQGYFTLEAEAFLRAYNEENVFEGVQKLAESARKLADMYEAID